MNCSFYKKIVFFALLTGFVVLSSIKAQNVTTLIKGKVVDQSQNILSGVQVQFREGEISAGKSKSQSNGEFTLVLKPGTKYSAIFDRNDIFQPAQEFVIPPSTSYQEIQKTFIVKTFKKGDQLGEYHVFTKDKADIIEQPFFESISQMMKKMRSLTINIIVSNSNKAKKVKPIKKKGKTAISALQISFVQLRIKALMEKLTANGTSDTRILLIEGNVKAPNDIQVTVSDIEASF